MRFGLAMGLVFTLLDIFLPQQIMSLYFRSGAVQEINAGVVYLRWSTAGFLLMLAAFAEFERDMIIERTQTGKQMARNDPSFRDGRPPLYGKQQISHALDLLGEGKTYKQVEQLTGMSKSTLIRAKRKAAVEHGQ